MCIIITDILFEVIREIA